MAKSIAQKVAGKLKASGTSQRFGAGAGIASAKPEKAAVSTQSKSIPVSFRLPAELVTRLRERALTHEGGLGGVVAAAAEHWLAATKGSAPSSKN